MMFTMPLSMSCWVVVLWSHFTWKASLASSPAARLIEQREHEVLDAGANRDP